MPIPRRLISSTPPRPPYTPGLSNDETKGRNHMQSITKKLFPTLVAVCVMSVVGSATASAYTNPILENAKGEHASKVKFTG